jgi:hypothetical protein
MREFFLGSRWNLLTLIKNEEKQNPSLKQQVDR